MATTAERKALQRELAAEGYSISVTAWPAKLTYYKPDGEPLPNLPADASHMRAYMQRGLSPVRPQKPELPLAVVVETALVSEVAVEQLKPEKAAPPPPKVGRPRRNNRRKHQKENGQ